ncbi:MAG: hypothetical protein ABJD24_18875 [Acidimicrobiales bacterium]
MAVGGALGVLLAAFFFTVGLPLIALPFAVVAIGLTSVSTIAVTIDSAGLHIAFGPWGVPKKRIALTDIESAQAIDVRPMRWGGWGYRWVPWKRASAVVLRGGPGVKVNRVGGRTFVVTVDGAPRAAAVLNELKRA